MTLALNELTERLWPGRSICVEPLVGGVTNKNYFVDLGNEQVVLRIAGENTELLGIDRRCESVANQLAASIGVAPSVLMRSEDEGWMISRFLPGRAIPPQELQVDPMLSRLAETFARIHRAGSIDVQFNPLTIVRGYHETARERDVVEPFGFDGACVVLERIYEARPFRPIAFCHNDLLNGNFIFDGEIRILDWEYAGMGDPFFDLANFSVNHALPEVSDEILLRGYFGHSDDSLLATLQLMKMVSELREAMWGAVQMAISTIEFDFRAYCEERAAHFEELLSAVDLDEATRLAASVSGVV